MNEDIEDHLANWYVGNRYSGGRITPDSDDFPLEFCPGDVQLMLPLVAARTIGARRPDWFLRDFNCEWKRWGQPLKIAARMQPPFWFRVNVSVENLIMIGNRLRHVLISRGLYDSTCARERLRLFCRIVLVEFSFQYRDRVKSRKS